MPETNLSQWMSQLSRDLFPKSTEPRKVWNVFPIDTMFFPIDTMVVQGIDSYRKVIRQSEVLASRQKPTTTEDCVFISQKRGRFLAGYVWTSMKSPITAQESGCAHLGFLALSLLQNSQLVSVSPCCACALVFSASGSQRT